MPVNTGHQGNYQIPRNIHKPTPAISSGLVRNIARLTH